MMMTKEDWVRRLGLEPVSYTHLDVYKRQELDIPVKFIGFGEKVDDIGEFHSEDFMKGLLEGIL